MPEESDGSYGLLDAQVLARLMGRPLMARFPMQGSVSGQHKSPHRGSSVEFSEYRAYMPGDDIRRLDWRVYGRTDRYYLKEFEAETNLRCYLVLDCSASMAFGSGGASGGGGGGHGTKLELAKKLMATLAYLVLQQGDAVGLLTAGHKVVHEIPPRRSPSHLQLILDAVHKTEAKGETGLISALHGLAEKMPRRSLVIVFSDCFFDLEPFWSSLQHLRFEKHDLALFHLLDRQEIDFDFERPTRFVDLESSFSLVTDPSLVREAYLEQFRQFLEALQSGCHQFKADYRQVVTDQDYEKALGNFLVDRAATVARRPA